MTTTKTYRIELGGELIETKKSRAKKTYTHAVIATGRKPREIELLKDAKRRGIQVRKDSWIPSAERGSKFAKPNPAKAETYRQEIKELTEELEALIDGTYPELQPCRMSWHTRRDLAVKKKEELNNRFHCEIVKISPE